MPNHHDQLNRPIQLPAVPKRIISIVPSQTELLFYLGLNKEIVGITKFCIHPKDKFKTVTRVGGTKQLDLAKIKALRPDLIIANKEENERNQIEELMNLCPVWISDINDLEGAVDMIERVGVLVNRATQAKALADTIVNQFSNLVIPPTTLRAAYFIWQKPYIVAGKNTFIDNMLQKCGLVNAFDIDRYPEINADMLIKAQPDVILLSSEPYPFKQKHIAELQEIMPSAIIKLVDGELFSWYGNRLLHAPRYFEQLMTGLNNS